MDWPVSLSVPGAEASAFFTEEWAVWPAALRPSPPAERGANRGGETRLVAWAAPSPFVLVAPGQEGWAVIPPAPPAEPRRDRRAYFQPS